MDIKGLRRDPIGTVRTLAGVARTYVDSVRRDVTRVLSGRTARGVTTRAYDGATTSRRMSSWVTASSDGNAEALAGFRNLTDRSRDLERNSPHGRRILLEFAADLVGTGLRPQAQTGSDRLDRQWLAAWEDFAAQCDPLTCGTAYGQQFAAALALARDGGLLVRRQWHRAGKLAIPLTISQMEIDYLDSSLDGTGGQNRIIGGIEFDPEGFRKAYHLYKVHPGANWSSLLPTETRILSESIAVPASEILHLYGYTTARPGMVTAVPWLAPVMQRLWELDGWADATSVARRMSQSVSCFVQGGDADGAIDGVDGAGPVDGEKVVDGRDYPVETFEPGIVAYLPPGKTVTFPQAPAVPQHEEYARVTLREIMAGTGTPYEAGTADLSQVSFISGRMGRISRRALMDSLREQVFTPLYCRPIGQWMTDAAILAGRLPSRKGGYPVDWVMTRREEADELARVKAVVAKIRAGLTSWERAIREEGLDPESLLDEIRRSNAGFDAEPMIILDSDPRRTSDGGQAQATDPTGSSPLQSSGNGSSSDNQGGGAL